METLLVQDSSIGFSMNPLKSCLESGGEQADDQIKTTVFLRTDRR